jgi:mannose-6-phosphate isomerase
MAIEHARAHAQSKPWGVVDLRPWSDRRHDGSPIGEIWYERPEGTTVNSSLLLKILFTSQALSIQVHPDDAFARSIGLPNGKAEAWYVLSAGPDAKVALGLNQSLTPSQLRQAADNGSVSDLVVWHAVSPNEVIFVPARTIHSIGAGLVIAEIQQRSDATFRLFDHGSQRELNIESAIMAANAGPADPQTQPSQLSDERTLLVSNPHFVFERINLTPNSDWRLEVDQETWLLALCGSARVGSFDIRIGDAIFAQSDRADIHAGPTGMVCLAAYTGSDPAPHLLQSIGGARAMDGQQPQTVQTPTLLPQETKSTPVKQRLDLSR